MSKKFTNLEEAKKEWPEISLGRAKIKPNDVFGNLVVLYRTTSENKGTYYVCQCQCEEKNIIKVNAGHLKSNNVHSCGCFTKNRITKYNEEVRNDFILQYKGKKFNKLTLIEPIENNTQYPGIIWKCQCECGNYINVFTRELTSNHTKSCGRCPEKGSLGEQKIAKILDEANIIYKREYSFSDCSNKQPLRFDFYIPEQNYLIEFDGEFHYNFTNYGWNTEENFNKIKERDKIKNQYCIDNKIPLIRIPYIYYETLSLQDLILDTTKFRVC